MFGMVYRVNSLLCGDIHSPKKMKLILVVYTVVGRIKDSIRSVFPIFSHLNHGLFSLKLSDYL